jgi:hypothetical protein
MSSRSALATGIFGRLATGLGTINITGSPALGYWLRSPATCGLGYWGWGDGGYFFNAGYWGTTIGFYGGIDYGFGYFGHGYDGGRWNNGHFFYNTAISHVDTNRIHNVYNTRVNETSNRVS